MGTTPPLDTQYIDLLEIDTFRVVKDKEFPNAKRKGVNNLTEHWIAHMCTAYEEDDVADLDDKTGAFDSDEIKEGKCYYCKLKIPEAIVALWSMLEWESAGDILYTDNETYKTTALVI